MRRAEPAARPSPSTDTPTEPTTTTTGQTNAVTRSADEAASRQTRAPSVKDDVPARRRDSVRAQAFSQYGAGSRWSTARISLMV